MVERMSLKFQITNFFQRVRYGRGASVVVEIGTDLFKIIQVREKGGRIRLQNLKVVRIADLKQPLYEEIPLIFRSLGIRAKHVTTYLPRKLVTTRFLEVPSTDEQELKEIMRIQGIKQTPYSPDEVALAYAVVGSRQDGMSDVVLAFCQRKFVDERVHLLEQSGFAVKRISISTEGVVDWYIAHQVASGLDVPKDLVVLIDQDLSFSDVIFCREGKLIYSKNILIGSQQMALEAAHPEQQIERFCEEVKQAIEFATEEAKLTPLKKGILMAPIKDGRLLRQALEFKLQIPIEFYNPAQDLNMPADSMAHMGSITPLIGFGQPKTDFLFDLMPEDLKLGIALEKRNRQMAATALLSLGLLAVISFLIASHFYKKKEYLETLEMEIGKTKEYAESIEEKLSRTRLIERVRNPKTSFLNYLSKISGILAPEIYFSSINFASEDRIILKGYAGQMSEVFDFAKALEELKIFKGVKSERVSKKKEDDRVVAEFEIHCLL